MQVDSPCKEEEEEPGAWSGNDEQHIFHIRQLEHTERDAGQDEQAGQQVHCLIWCIRLQNICPQDQNKTKAMSNPQSPKENKKQ